MSIKLLKIILLLLLSIMAVGCATAPRPKNINNVCSIFRENPDWYHYAKRSQYKHGVPIPVQMAIMREESQFVADARPPRKKILWIIPGKHISSAYGYSQALDGTWRGYQQSTHQFGADRDEFADAIDFLGWYNRMAARTLGIPNNDAYSLYLAYHEGLAGYKHGSYRKKAWLRVEAKSVKRQAGIFDRQLSRCAPTLERKKKSSWW